jgi:hypothetical protein
MGSFSDRYKDIETQVLDEIGPRLDRIEDILLQRPDPANARLDRIERILQGLSPEYLLLPPC